MLRKVDMLQEEGVLNKLLMEIRVSAVYRGNF